MCWRLGSTLQNDFEHSTCHPFFWRPTGGVILILWCLLTIIVGIIQTCKGKSLWDTPPAVEMILAYGWLAWVSLFAFVVIPYWVLTKMFGLSLP
jgi:hypothetical protein